MQKRAPGKVVRYNRLIDALRGVARSLPTAAEKQEILASSRAIVDFLNDLRTQLELIPTSEDMVGADRAIAELERLFDTSSRKPVLAAVLGQAVKYGADDRRRSRERGRQDVEALIDTLQSLPVDEIEARLRSSSYSVGRLRDIAVALGFRPDRTAEREGLAHQIAMTIANYRGYQRMSGQSATDGT